MPYQLSDIYIGNFPQTQSFGARPDVYNARYGLRAHNGIDIACPSKTPILATADGWVYKIGLEKYNSFDTSGYGRYIKLVHDAIGDGFFKTTSAHLDSVVVTPKQLVKKGQLIGYSNNTGFSDGPHLHFGVAPCDANGIDLEPNNGYSGYIDPNGARCSWNIQNPTEPVTVEEVITMEKIPVPSNDFQRMVAEGSAKRTIVAYLIKKNLNAYLTGNGYAPVDNDKPDPLDGERCVKFIAELLNEVRRTEEDNLELQKRLNGGVAVTEENIDQLTDAQKSSILKTLMDKLSGFIWTTK